MLSNILPRHQIDEFMKYLTSIESMTAKCLERPTTSQNPNAHDVLASTSGSRDAVPSTSGINTTHASSSSNIRINDSINNNCDDDINNTRTSIDEEDFGTQNKVESLINIL